MTPHSARPLPLSVSVALAFFAAVTVLLGGFAAAAVRAADPGSDTSVLLAGACIAGAYCLVVASVWGVTRARGLTLEESVAWRAPASWSTALGFALVVALTGRLIGGIWALALQWFGVELPGADVDPTAFFGSSPLGVVVAVLTMVVVAPVAEEFVFRGALLTSLDDALGPRAAIALSSLAFALVHVTAYTVPPIFAFGLLLGMLTLRMHSLPVAIVSHALFNGIAVVVLYGIKAGWTL